MREILFRGKRLDNGEWVHGYLYEHEPPIQCIVPDGYAPEKSKWCICKTAFADWNMPRQIDFVVVDPDTIGQFVGFTDKNGVKAFEGDIIRGEDTDTDGTVEIYTAVIVIHNGAVCYKDGGCIPDTVDHIADHEYIAGNQWDNPELVTP